MPAAYSFVSNIWGLSL